MKTCTRCHTEKAEAHFFRLGVDEKPVCKSCLAMQSPEAEFEAMRTVCRTLDTLADDARGRVLQYLHIRFGQAQALARAEPNWKALGNGQA